MSTLESCRDQHGREQQLEVEQRFQIRERSHHRRLRAIRLKASSCSLLHCFQFLKTLGELRAELQSRLLEDNDHDHTSQTTIYHTRPSAEDLATYDTRVETLRRKRDDLLAAAAAASATDGCDESSTLLSSPASDIDEIKAASSPNEQVVHSITGSSSSTHNIKTASRVRSNDRDHGKRGSRTGKQAWRTGRGAENAEQKAEAAQADEVAHEIATMASKLKESSMAINKTLRTQTQVSCTSCVKIG